ncbi:MAG TPA: ABC transporter substrate-binding protein [Candidatus Limnocylindria bacterium]|nr:ABC transporter substrate-binding protein [Candidatus Limnocylindria bacterium]
MRPAALLLALALAACTTAPPAIPGPSPTPEPGFLDVTALLDLSGSRAPRGEPQRNALQLWTDLDRARGGGQARVRLKVVDVGGSDARVLIELRRAAVEERADAVIVGVPVSFATPAFSDAVRVAAMPVILTLPATEPSGIGAGRWIFSVAPTPEQVARRMVVPATRALVLVRDDRPPDPEAAALVREHEQRLLSSIVFRVGSQDQAVVARAAADAGRVYLAGPPRDWAALAPVLRTSARLPTYVLSWLADPADLGELRELDSVWPGAASLGASLVSGTRREVVRGYADRHGAPTSAALGAYDAVSALALAAERVGPDDRERLREALELVAFVGVASTYAFSETRHAGFSGDDVALYRWSGGHVVADLRR